MMLKNKLLSIFVANKHIVLSTELFVPPIFYLQAPLGNDVRSQHMRSR